MLMFTLFPFPKENFPETQISIQWRAHIFFLHRFWNKNVLSSFPVLYSLYSTAIWLLPQPFIWNDFVQSDQCLPTFWALWFSLSFSYLKFDTADHPFFLKTLSYLGFHYIILLCYPLISPFLMGHLYRLFIYKAHHVTTNSTHVMVWTLVLQSGISNCFL